MTYEEFKSEVLGKGFDVDGYFGEQCVDLAMYYCQRLGYPHPNCTKTGYAQDWWTERATNGILNNFYEVTMMEPGDIAIFKRSGSTPLSHVAIFDHDIDGVRGAFLGQNQGGKIVSGNGGSASNIISLPYSATYETAFRPKCFAKPDPIKHSDFPLEGADISAHNSLSGPWADLDFLIPRCSYGENEDKSFSNFVGKYKNKIRGVYVFSYALDVQQAKQEAAYAVNLAKKYGLVDPVIFYDYEYDSIRWAKQNGKTPAAADVQAMTVAFAQTISAAGFQPGVYLNLDYWNSFYKGYSFKDQKIWFACYNHNLSIPGDVVDIWQYSSDGYDHNRAKADAFVQATQIKELPLGPDHSVYRLYNPNSGDHLYTLSIDEARGCRNAGWTYEGVAWIAPKEGDPVYRLYAEGRHIFTSNPDEKKNMILQGAADEGIAFRSSGPIEIWRMYNPNTGDHVLTASREEHDALSKAGWYCEGQKLSAMETP